MNDLKEILIFISFTLKRYFLNLVSHLLYLVLVLILAVFAFFQGYKTFQNHYAFIGFLIVLVLINIKIRGFLYKHQLIMDVLLVRFLDDQAAYAQALGKHDIPKDLARRYVEVKAQIKKENPGILSRRLSASLFALKLNREDVDFKYYLSIGKPIILAFAFFQLAIILIMWIPFAGISLLFIGGLSASVQYLIFLVGFFFVYFLNAAIVAPIVALLVVKKIASA